jgi:hypothetical protein
VFRVPAAHVHAVEVQHRVEELDGCTSPGTPVIAPQTLPFHIPEGVVDADVLFEGSVDNSRWGRRCPSRNRAKPTPVPRVITNSNP